jgi:hypothetical protein
MLRHLLILCLFLQAAAGEAPATPQQAAIQQAMEAARKLDRERKLEPALAGALAALPAYDAAAAATVKWSWSDLAHLRWAGGVARRIKRPDDAVTFAEKLLALAGEDKGWINGARTDLAMARVLQGRTGEADAIYIELIAAGDDEAQLNRALLLLRELDRRDEGVKLFEQALANAKIADWRRYNEAYDEARRQRHLGDIATAERLYGLIQTMPAKADEQAKRSPAALVELGAIAEGRGDAAKAKQLYAKALASEGADAGTRVRARNAIEAIAYFE